jgi:hypothetical protein
MTRRGPVPKSLVLVLLLPFIVVLGLLLSWARSSTPYARGLPVLPAPIVSSRH